MRGFGERIDTHICIAEFLLCSPETVTTLLIGYQFSCSVVCDSLWPHGLQHARLPCPSPTPGAYSNSMSIESVMPSNHLILCGPLLLLPSIFPSIRAFQMSQFFLSGDQIIGVSVSASVLPMDIQDWFPLGLIWSPCSPRDSKVFSNTIQKHQ